MNDCEAALIWRGFNLWRFDLLKYRIDGYLLVGRQDVEPLS